MEAEKIQGFPRLLLKAWTCRVTLPTQLPIQEETMHLSSEQRATLRLRSQRVRVGKYRCRSRLETLLRDATPTSHTACP